VAVLLFLTLLGSYAYFWQSRDWNTATRLMLTYSLADRHVLTIDGLEQQAGQREFNPLTRRFEIVAGDLARFGPHYFTDKAPGQSLLGLPVYAMGKLAGLLPHPLHRPAIAYWPADYWVTLGTSGVCTAALAVVLYAFSLRLGATHFGGVLVGLGYGLGSPAFLYATLFYGHQAAAFCATTSFFLLYRAANEGRASAWHMIVSGLLAGLLPVIEYQTIGLSVILGIYAVVAVHRVRPIVVFVFAAGFAASLLAVYNLRAFGHPLELSYAHEVSREFQAIHSADNPIGLRVPDARKAGDTVSMLLSSSFRGLAFFAPILLAVPLGLVVLFARRFWGVELVVVDAFAWMLFVNVSYPLPEGGWCTGPRFLLPALPFLFLAVAGLLGLRLRGVLNALMAVAVTASAGLMLGCVAVGGRFPPVFRDPIMEIVVPRWGGNPTDGVSAIAGGRQFEWNVGRWLLAQLVPAEWQPPEPSPWLDLQFAPLAVFWLVMFGVLAGRTLRRRGEKLLPASAVEPAEPLRT